MKIAFLHFYKKISTLFLYTKTRGFIIPLALLICVIILAIATSISTILSKEVYFSRLSRQSQVAYYAADNGMMCATMVDDSYVDPATGSGIFPYDPLLSPDAHMQNTLAAVNIQRGFKGYPSLTLNSIKCATSDIFNQAVTGFSVGAYSRINSSGVTENGKSSLFAMRMDLGDGTVRCATIIVNKTANYRQIISRGFSSCGGSGLQTIERAVVSTSELR